MVQHHAHLAPARRLVHVPVPGETPQTRLGGTFQELGWEQNRIKGVYSTPHTSTGENGSDTIQLFILFIQIFHRELSEEGVQQISRSKGLSSSMKPLCKAQEKLRRTWTFLHTILCQNHLSLFLASVPAKFDEKMKKLKQNLVSSV